jgi:uncharacterized protein (DUF2062 family)
MQPVDNFKSAVLNLFKAGFVFLYLRPRKFVGELFSKKGLSGIAGLILNPNQTDELKAVSAAFGVFIGILPIWGFQTLTAIFFAVVFRLNKALVVICSQVSFPPLMPVIIFLSYKTGLYWMDKGSHGTVVGGSVINKNIEQYIFGSLTLAILAGITVGLLTFAALKLAKALKQYKAAAALKKALKSF